MRRTEIENCKLTDFYDIKSVTDQEIVKKMKCVADKFLIWGDYNSNKASNLVVMLEKCTKRYAEKLGIACKTDL